MIFQYTWQKVLSGQKSQTRRLARETDKLWAVEREDKTEAKVLLRNDRAKWRTGRTYAVQPGRNQKAIARIRLLDIRHQLLGHISEAEARAEGYASPEAFREVWHQIHGSYDPKQPVWVLEFRLVK